MTEPLTVSVSADPATPEPPGRKPSEGKSSKEKPEPALIGWLLRARTIPTTRADLRRGDRPALAERAYPHLARFWAGQPSARQPVLLLAAAAAEHSHIGHVGDTAHRFAASARDLIGPKEKAEDCAVGERLLAIQRQSLPNAHRMLGGIFRGLDDRSKPINWAALWDTYRYWDHPNPTIRRAVRRRLLEDFFGVPDPS